jgi:hypothetical protein
MNLPPPPPPHSTDHECATAIKRFLRQDFGGLRRLKELLPVFFSWHRVYTIETQRLILMQCNLTPTTDGPLVTFLYPPEPRATT